MERLLSLLGIVVLLGIGVLFSDARRRIPWRVVVVGTLLQAYLALFLVRSAWVPWALPVASALCLAGILVPRRPGEGSLATFGRMLARALGCAGVATALIHAAVLFPGPAAWLPALALLLAAAVALRRVPALRAPCATTCAVAGCLLAPVLVWWGGLPEDFLYRALGGVGSGVTWLVGFAEKGMEFVFGGIVRDRPFVFALNVSAIILLFSALMSVLYHVGFLPWLVGLMARFLHRGLGVSGAESLSAAANVFVGQTEAPLVVRPYLDRMTRSEITALMAGGFATIAGSVLGVYVSMLDAAHFTGGAAHLIAASVMSAPASFVLAKLFVPETGEPETRAGADPGRVRMGDSFLDALAGGVTAGLRLAVNVAAMLLVFYAVIEILNTGVNAAARWMDPGSLLTFRSIYASLFAPFAFLMGVPWRDCYLAGELLGTKTIFNEFFAYQDLGAMVDTARLGRRGAVLSTYALCGFANFMSIGIQIGGLSALAPGRRPDFAKLALKAMIAGALACQLTACIVGVMGDF